jgi:hypothetical protein
MEEKRITVNGCAYLVDILNDDMKNVANELEETQNEINRLNVLYDRIQVLSAKLFGLYIQATDQMPRYGFTNQINVEKSKKK